MPLSHCARPFKKFFKCVRCIYLFESMHVYMHTQKERDKWRDTSHLLIIHCLRSCKNWELGQAKAGVRNSKHISHGWNHHLLPAMLHVTRKLVWTEEMIGQEAAWTVEPRQSIVGWECPKGQLHHCENCLPLSFVL